MNVIDIEVANKLLGSVAEEMGIILARSAFSPNIKERRDFSCAVFDGTGELIAQAAHIPVHLGAMPMALAGVLAEIAPGRGDVVILNDPFRGGSHLPDITLVMPVFPGRRHTAGEKPAFYVVNRAHHADVGGKKPGSMGLSTNLADEGVLIPPTLLYRGGKYNSRFGEYFFNRVRNRREREGDLHAQTASLARGRRRLLELVDRYDPARFTLLLTKLKHYAARLMESAIQRLPQGTYEFTDYLDDDGAGTLLLPIRVKCDIRDSTMTVDFSDCAPQTTGPLNTVRPVTMSATVYVLQCLLGGDYPVNQGSFRPLTLITRPGTIVDARPPAAVAAGNVETSQRLVDVLLGALAAALPHRIPSASCGSMNNVAIGGADYAYYETIGGGMGAGPDTDGLSGIHTHLTNTLNTPVEALENAYPLQVDHYGLNRGSGGEGRHRGGDGIRRAYRFLEAAQVSLLTERRRLRPYGLQGGKDGKSGENLLYRNNRRKKLKGKCSLAVEAGDRLVLKTPGGGGWGRI